MLRRLDEAILDRVERFSHWFQRLTGLTNFWLARIAIIPFVLLPACFIVNVAYAHPEVPLMLIAAPNLPFLLVGFWGQAMLRAVVLQLEHHYLSAPTVAHANTLKMRENWPIRVACGVAAITLLSTEVGSMPILPTAPFEWLGWLGIPLHMYLAACIPLPPGTSKIGELKNRLAAWWQGESVPGAVPNPA